MELDISTEADSTHVSLGDQSTDVFIHVANTECWISWI
jgi:hypothetical protein